MNLLESQLTAAFIISLLHGLIPSHWLPLVALSKQQKWTNGQLLRYALWASSAHVLGTIIIGLIIFYTAHLSFIGSLAESSAVSELTYLPFDLPFEKLAAVILLLLGLVFLYRHYTHKHFHWKPEKNAKWIFGSILLAMFLSPCMEIAGYFFAIAPLGWTAFIWLSLVYTLTTIVSIVAGVWIFNKGMKTFNSHKLEHNAGILTSLLIIISAVFMWFG
jgi:uncharacterized membrane protein